MQPNTRVLLAASASIYAAKRRLRVIIKEGPIPGCGLDSEGEGIVASFAFQRGVEVASVGQHQGVVTGRDTHARCRQSLHDWSGTVVALDA
ncbi:uncharacterized protein ATNIH1004_000687 [Aspergillus tanneri]|uniref:Uncharacterized protein n=1 Tax=Aspergillus tanneri TaxID=1220188 RepID=A0A5M9MXG0_9EURO|nr:uncharacterized protein ATNIH1004_000687 [Aspergillus tanneri]KAA8651791.1 hypothetical protein ATNIH1004_000687 [Aspergillus tanneri]